MLSLILDRQVQRAALGENPGDDGGSQKEIPNIPKSIFAACDIRKKPLKCDLCLDNDPNIRGL